MSNVNQTNIDRWSGFADIYNASRPVPPDIITQSILIYLESPPELVVDIGSGTGLSTMIWRGIVPKIIGIEPNDDMRVRAGESAAPNITYQDGISNQTGLPDDCANIVTISQAFHWMDIPSTLEEVYRVLKPGGVLAIYDCDWPPSIDWRIEQAYNALRRKCKIIEAKKEKPATQHDKSSYIDAFNAFGKFKFTKEIVLHSVEPCTPERMIGIALSQGAMQEALKLDPSIQEDINAFCDLIRERRSGSFDIVFSYRLRLAIK